MATFNEWVGGARPRTLPAAISPVLVGTGAAAAVGASDSADALLALCVALALQVGVNYANDYSDGVRGTDAARVGPVRLVGQGLSAPSSVKFAAFLSFALAGLFGLALVAITQTFILIPIGIGAIVAAWTYTGGDRPYGYRALGEVMVFVFFGLVATLGTLYTQALTLTLPGLLGAVGIGSLASAILVANNLRDLPGDAAAGKHTLAVRLGDAKTRSLWVALVAVAMACAVGTALIRPWALLALGSLAFAARPVRALRSSATGRELIPVLAGTGILQLAYAVLLAIGLSIGGAA